MEALGSDRSLTTAPKRKFSPTALYFLLPFAVVFFATLLFWTPAEGKGLAAMDNGPALTEDFGVREAMTLDMDRLKKWTNALERHEAALNDESECYNSTAAFCFKTYWTELTTELATMDRADQLVRINNEVNSWAYSTDRAAWGLSDYWATPEEMFNKGSGDCEDVAIFKYLLLRAAGVAADDMTLMVTATGTHAHMVLIVAREDGAVVLDNLTNAIMLASDSNRTDVPLYSLSEAGWQMLAVNKKG